MKIEILSPRGTNPFSIEVGDVAVFIGNHMSGKATAVKACGEAGYATHICPENGFHPNSLKMVADHMREQVPVAIKTHSPYFLDWFEPSDVYVCSRDADFTFKITRLSHINIKEDGFSLGELWSSIGEIGLIKKNSENHFTEWSNNNKL